MYKLYESDEEAFKAFELDGLLLASHEKIKKNLKLDFYKALYDKNIKKNYEQMSFKDENIIVNEYSLYKLFSFRSDIFYGPLLCLENFKLKRSFKGFKIAVYKGFSPNKASSLLIKACQGEEISFDRARKSNGYSLLRVNEPVALAAAAAIVFDAYDSGADFMLVEDVYSFYIFDKLAKKLEISMNRKLEGFYILSFAQMLSLASSHIPKSLNTNVLKASLV